METGVCTSFSRLKAHVLKVWYTASAQRWDEDHDTISGNRSEPLRPGEGGGSPSHKYQPHYHPGIPCPELPLIQRPLCSHCLCSGPGVCVSESFVSLGPWRVQARVGGGCPGPVVLPCAVPTSPLGLSAAVSGEHCEPGARTTPPQGTWDEEARTRLSFDT